ncbi:MAG TPA: regulatory protein RecX [Stellaceae bacterium]|nr:regulatory protein RecX [Stellaceae bacterium]
MKITKRSQFAASDDPDEGKGTARKARGGKPITPAYLENAALHYLERFASSSANLKRVLTRKVIRAAAAGHGDIAEGERLVDALIARYVAAGLVDDKAYAAQRAASLRRQGNSRFAIRGKLALKGVERTLIERALGELDEDDAQGEIAAASALVRRRRLGPFRPAAARKDAWQKDLAALARAGFSLDVARRVLRAADPDALEALARGDAADSN